MSRELLPFNIDLLIVTLKELSGVPEIKVLDIFDGVSKNFHNDGLFSITSFGRVGEENRNRLVGYIDLKLDIFHPVMFKIICDLKSLYPDILSSKKYAIFDEKKKDFIEADPITGQTGYEFFCKHYLKIDPALTGSGKREEYVKSFNSRKNSCMMSKLLVTPAGLRDYVVDEAGKPSEDDINKMYRKVLSIANTVSGLNRSMNLEFLDSIRMKMQVAVKEIYDYLMDMIDGKNKFILGEWAARTVYESTRNVISAYIPRHSFVGSNKSVSTNQTMVGLYQYLRAVHPLATKQIKEGFMSSVFTGPNTPAVLVNPKTLKKQLENNVSEYYEKWMTLGGLEKTFASFGNEYIRNNPIMVGDMYAGLIYLDYDKKIYKFFQDIDDLPEGFDRKNVSPITYAQLLYTSVYPNHWEIPSTLTRYPISGYGSIYPSYVYLCTTMVGYEMNYLADDWVTPLFKVNEFPKGDEFLNSMVISPVHNARAGADYDGDMMSFIAILSKDGQSEIKKIMNSRSYYVGPDNKMAFSAEDDIISITLKYMLLNQDELISY